MKSDEIRSYGPGKFRTIVDQYVYMMSLDGADEDVGESCNGGTWYGKMTDLAGFSPDIDFPELNSAERLLLCDSVGAIVSENDLGFVEVQYYTNSNEFERAWMDIVDSQYYEKDEYVGDGYDSHD